MKKINKFFIFALVLLGLISSSNLNVNAKTAPGSITMREKSRLYYFSETSGTDYISGYNFYRKQLTDGTYAYCVSNIDTKVPAGRELASKGPITDKGLDYIIKNGYPNKTLTGDSLKDYYITQSAIWEYFDETRGSSNWGRTSFSSSSSGMKKYVYNLVQGAKAARNASDPTSSISVSISDKNMTLSADGKYYVSKTITVNQENTKDTYTVNLINAPKGTILKTTTGETKTTFNKGEKFVVYVPASKVTESTTIQLTVGADGVTTATYYYSIGSSSYQDISPVTIYEIITPIVSNKLTLKIDKKITKLKISKQDITSKEELPGATLTLKTKSGTLIDEWVSGNEPHYIEGLAAGEYSLTEKLAPSGYVLSTETINFTLEADGSVKTVVMYNTKEKEPTKYKISKQDITSKEELPGATLTIKDSSGTVVETWVSGNEPHYVTDLKVGTYTLTEEIAPEGYVLSTETIEFKVEKDGKIKTVIMYNEREQEPTKYKISKQDITSKEELPGATLTLKTKSGTLIDEWVSGNEPHYIEGLAAGEYSLTEKLAPSGYVLSTETINFTLEADGSVKTVVMYNTKEKEPTKYKISKQDITSKEELPGATLTIKDSSGTVVETWVSGNEPHYVTDLKVGTYTLTEEIAPEGYILSTETIEFKVEKDGKVKTVVMYNARDTKVTKVIISKQDITSKEELPGATLTIKDSNGNVVETWVSGNDPHYIEGLAAGDYTLTEEIAPEGYILSSETIKFTVKDDGSVTSVVMYNSRYTEVPITDLNVSSWTIVGAVVLMALGAGLVFYAKRNY